MRTGKSVPHSQKFASVQMEFVMLVQSFTSEHAILSGLLPLSVIIKELSAINKGIVTGGLVAFVAANEIVGTCSVVCTSFSLRFLEDFGEESLRGVSRWALFALTLLGWSFVSSRARSWPIFRCFR